MKTLCAASFALISMALGSGCASTADMVRHYAAQELRCPETQIRTREVAPGAFVARGCGRRTMYIDNAAPSYIPTQQTGTETVTVRVARNP
ncbi:MAG: hypothetical protein WCJ30_07950 [Deltaproteobacteria bacterium]